MRWWRVAVIGTAVGAAALLGQVAWATMIAPRPSSSIVGPPVVVGVPGVRPTSAVQEHPTPSTLPSPSASARPTFPDRSTARTTSAPRTSDEHGDDDHPQVVIRDPVQELPDLDDDHRSATAGTEPAEKDSLDRSGERHSSDGAAEDDH